MNKIAFIGLGNMGLAIAQNLINAGYELNVYNRSKDKAQKLNGVFNLFDTPAAAAAEQDFVFTMLADDDSLNTVTIGEHGFLKSMKKDAIHISMSTISPDTSKTLYDLHLENGSHYLTSPVFGRPNAAAEAKLYICISGDPEIKERAKPLLNTLGQALYDFGTEPTAANVVN